MLKEAGETCIAMWLLVTCQAPVYKEKSTVLTRLHAQLCSGLPAGLLSAWAVPHRAASVASYI